MADGVMVENLKKWAISGARTQGFYRGKESIMALNTKKLSEDIMVAVAEATGEEQGENSMSNEQNDNMTESSTIMDKAELEWYAWAKENNIDHTNTQPETYKLMAEAFMDGYTNGFVKRFTEGE